jgi:hypothetical protein
MTDYWNFGLPNLRNLGRGCFLWWCSGNWNDLISSIRTEAYSITFFEHIDYTGESITVAPNTIVSNLVDWGWNDRISSLALVL